MKLEGYTFRGSYWIDGDGLVVCDSLADELNRRYLNQWWAEHGNNFSAKQAAIVLGSTRRTAVDANSRSGMRWVQTLARKMLARYPQDPYIAPILAASLRSEGSPLAALREGMPLLKPGPSALRTTLAASLCDLNRWDEAHALLGTPCDAESWAVRRRIEAHAGGV